MLLRLLVLQLPYEQLRLLLEQRSSEVEVLRNRLEQWEASLDALKKNYESQVGVTHLTHDGVAAAASWVHYECPSMAVLGDCVRCWVSVVCSVRCCRVMAS